ncbi:MAG: peptidoglycan bridge formation glycyltransferase FemA/FemB family protein [Bacteroidota bacterium]
MSVNWNYLYTDQNPPLWYRVDSEKGMRYLLMVDMDGILVSLPYFSWALFTDQKPEVVVEHITFTLKDGRLTCNDEKVKWQVRLLRPVSENVESHKVVSWLPLTSNVEAQMAALHSNVRRKIRKAQKNGVIIKTGGPELSDQFYNIYSLNMHRLGAPAMAPDFYKRIVEAFGNNGKILIAKYQGRKIGAALWLKNGDKAEACWFATLNDSNILYTSYLLWWECIRLACVNDCSVFSFGRSSRGSGTHHYKCQWGTRNSTLYWSYSGPCGQDSFRLGPLKFMLPGRTILSVLWKLMPRFIVRRLGPLVAGKFYQF